MASALTDQLDEPQPRMLVVLVSLQMVNQLVDPSAQKGYLHFRRTRVLIVDVILTYDGVLLVLA